MVVAANCAQHPALLLLLPQHNDRRWEVQVGMQESTMLQSIPITCTTSYLPNPAALCAAELHKAPSCWPSPFLSFQPCLFWVACCFKHATILALPTCACTKMPPPLPATGCWSGGSGPDAWLPATKHWSITNAAAGLSTYTAPPMATCQQPGSMSMQLQMSTDSEHQY
jgi:hypothetical protein